MKKLKAIFFTSVKALWYTKEWIFPYMEINDEKEDFNYNNRWDSGLC